MNTSPDLLMETLRMVMVLALLLSVLLAGLYLSRRMMKKKGARGKHGLIRVLANRYIGVKKTISLVEVPGSILVIGITSDRICLLSRIEDEAVIERIGSHTGDDGQVPFAGQLGKLMGRAGLRDK